MVKTDKKIQLPPSIDSDAQAVLDYIAQGGSAAREEARLLLVAKRLVEKLQETEEGQELLSKQPPKSFKPKVDASDSQLLANIIKDMVKEMPEMHHDAYNIPTSQVAGLLAVSNDPSALATDFAMHLSESPEGKARLTDNNGELAKMLLKHSARAAEPIAVAMLGTDAGKAILEDNKASREFFADFNGTHAIFFTRGLGEAPSGAKKALEQNKNALAKLLLEKSEGRLSLQVLDNNTPGTQVNKVLSRIVKAALPKVVSDEPEQKAALANRISKDPRDRLANEHYLYT